MVTKPPTVIRSNSRLAATLLVANQVIARFTADHLAGAPFPGSTATGW
jgi:hypothetical protein